MNTKFVAVGAGALGALIGWAVTADHFEAKMKRNQLILGEMLARKEAQIVALEEKLLDPVPWNSPTIESVQSEAEKVDRLVGYEDGVIQSDTEGEVAFTLESINGHSPECNALRANEDWTCICGVDPDEDDISEEQTAELRSNIQHVIEQYSADPDNVDEFVARAGAMIEHANDVPPFHISVALYASDPDEGDDYSKITLGYYPRIRVLLDDQEEVIEDIDNTVGWKNLNRFGDESEDRDTVFVRNRRMMSDFEIVKYDDEDPPLHVQYGMGREEYKTAKAAGIIKSRDPDRDRP